MPCPWATCSKNAHHEDPIALDNVMHILIIEDDLDLGRALQSPREFNLLLELAREPGAVVPKDTLAQRMEPLGAAVDFAVIEVHACNLRRKIGAQRIKTERGIGYILVP